MRRAHAKLPRFPAVRSCGAGPSGGGTPPQLSELQLDVVTDRQRAQAERAAELTKTAHRHASNESRLCCDAF